MKARAKGRKPDLVDQAEITERLGVGTTTVSRWRRRSVLPPPDLQVGSTDVWLWETVRSWAGQTSRSLRSRKSRARPTPPDVVDLAGVAARLGVSSRTAASWQRTGALPDPDYRWEDTQAWLSATIDRWSSRTAGRVPRLFRPGDQAPTTPIREPSGFRLAVAPLSPADGSPAGGGGPPDHASSGRPIRAVSNPKAGPLHGARDVTPARDVSADPIADIDQIQRYFAAMAKRFSAAAPD